MSDSWQVHTQASLSAATTALRFVGTARTVAPCPLQECTKTCSKLSHDRSADVLGCCKNLCPLGNRGPHTDTHTRARTHAQTHTHTQTHTDTHRHTHTHTRRHTQRHTHTRACGGMFVLHTCVDFSGQSRLHHAGRGRYASGCILVQQHASHYCWRMLCQQLLHAAAPSLAPSGRV